MQFTCIVKEKYSYQINKRWLTKKMALTLLLTDRLGLKFPS